MHSLDPTEDEPHITMQQTGPGDTYGGQELYDLLVGLERLRGDLRDAECEHPVKLFQEPTGVVIEIHKLSPVNQ